MTRRSRSSLLPEPKTHKFAPIESAIGDAGTRSAALQGELGARLRTHILSRLDETRARVLSLDVFDTVLLRNGLSEAGRYFALSERIAKSLGALGIHGISAMDLFITRGQAMELAYRVSPELEGCVEGRLDAVVSIQARMLRVPPAATRVMMAEELAYEAGVLQPNPPLLQAAGEFARRGGTVICVSDMYMPGEQIIALIRRVCGAVPFIKAVISSADVIVNKRSGTIFPRLAAQFERAPGEFLHVGDSFVSDFRRPREAGWHAFHLPVATGELDEREADLGRVLGEAAASGLDVSRWAQL